MLAGILLVLLLVRFVRHPARLDDPVVIVEGKQMGLDLRIDPNAADEVSLGRLPGVTEAMAKAIVQYRAEQAKATGDAKVFLTLEDLGRVKVGTRAIPKAVLEGMRPYLKLAGEPVNGSKGSGKLTPPKVLEPETQSVEPDRE
jgi:hypothetical protein